MGYTDDGIPFNTGSETSEAAALSQAEHLAKMNAMVIAFIRSRGSHGATNYEIHAALGLLPQTASARRNGLAKLGLIQDTGTKRPTNTGRGAEVWILVDGPPLPPPPKKPSWPALVRALQRAENQDGRLSVSFDIALQNLYRRLPAERRTR